MISNSIKINQYVTPFEKKALTTGKNIRNFYGFTPLKTGQNIPDFLPSQANKPGWLSLNLFKTTLNTKSNSLALFINNRPVVLIFRPIFHQNGRAQKAFLASLQEDIQIMGGSVFVISNASTRELKDHFGEHHRFQILSDPNNSIAESFGLYHPDNLIADWLSGVEGDISLPAFYVIQPNGVIGYHYIDYNFRTYQLESSQNGPSFVRQLLTKVYQNTQKSTRHKKVPNGA